LFGPKRDPLPLTVDAKEFGRKIGKLEGSHLVQLEVSPGESGAPMVLVKEIQRHPVSGAVLHADFCEVDLERKIRVDVPLKLTGKAKGVELGGILQLVRRELEVACLPTNIPAFIEVDVTDLDIHDAVHVNELTLPPGVEVEFETDFTVATVLAPTVEKVAAAEGEEEAAEGEAEGEGEAPAGEATSQEETEKKD